MKKEKDLKTLLECILDTTKTDIHVVDSERNIHFVNASSQNIYGDYQGKKCFEYFWNRNEECPDCMAEEILRTNKPAFQEEIVPKAGNKYFRITKLPFVNEEGKILIAEIKTDISEQKEQIRKLLEHERLSKDLKVSAYTISNFLKSILEEDRGNMDDETKRILKIIYNYSLEITKLADKLCKFSQLE